MRMLHRNLLLNKFKNNHFHPLLWSNAHDSSPSINPAYAYVVSAIYSQYTTTDDRQIIDIARILCFLMYSVRFLRYTRCKHVQITIGHPNRFDIGYGDLSPLPTSNLLVRLASFPLSTNQMKYSCYEKKAQTASNFCFYVLYDTEIKCNINDPLMHLTGMVVMVTIINIIIEKKHSCNLWAVYFFAKAGKNECYVR